MARQTFAWKIDWLISIVKRLLAGSASWPVGSIYISVNSTNPATSLGFGTWSAFGTGQVPVGIDTGDSDFNVDEETGGAKTATIATANLPNINVGNESAHTHTITVDNDAHSHTIRREAVFQSGADTAGARITGAGTWSAGDPIGSDTHNHTASSGGGTSHTHSLGGSGTALTIQQKYIVVRMWKRTA